MMINRSGVRDPTFLKRRMSLITIIINYLNCSINILIFRLTYLGIFKQFVPQNTSLSARQASDLSLHSRSLFQSQSPPKICGEPVLTSPTPIHQPQPHFSLPTARPTINLETQEFCTYILTLSTAGRPAAITCSSGSKPPGPPGSYPGNVTCYPSLSQFTDKDWQQPVVHEESLLMDAVRLGLMQ